MVHLPLEGVSTVLPPRRAEPAQPALEVAVVPLVAGLANPVGIANAADGSDRLFVLEKAGRVRVIQGRQLLARPFLDISDRVNSRATERGLLGKVTTVAELRGER